MVAYTDEDTQYKSSNQAYNNVGPSKSHQNKTGSGGLEVKSKRNETKRGP